MKEYFEIGQIVNTSGLKGLLKIKPFTDDIKRFSKLKTIYISINKELIEYEIEDVKYVKNMVLLKLKGIDSIDEAEKYRNYYVHIGKKDAPKLEKDSYFIADIEGCNVYEEGSLNLLGIVTEVFPTGSNDVYVVKSDDGKQILLPAIKEVIKQVDIENKKIIVKLLEGLV